MEFSLTNTYKNLAASFAGECQAGMRYQMIASKALQEGYKTLSDEIKQIAKNETVHAKTFFDFIIEKNGNTENIELNSGFPFNGDTVENGLLFASQQEGRESSIIYPEFSKVAQKEGFTEIADTFLRVADVESHHKIMFEYLYENYKNGTLFLSDKPVIYECSNCGFRFTAKQAFAICPLCKTSQGFVKLRLP